MNTPRFPQEEHVLVGEIVKAHGIRGEVKLHSASGQPETVARYQELIPMDKQGRLLPPLVIERSRPQGSCAIVAFAGVRHRNRAEELVGLHLLARKQDLPPLADNEYYWHQLLGLTVVTTDGQELGRISKISSNNAQDLLVVSGPEGELLIPMVEEIVLKQDDKQLIIAPPPGLLELGRR